MGPITATSTQLLEGLRDPANQAAWVVLDFRFRPIVHAAALRIGLVAEDAADVAQQTLVDVVLGFRAGKYDHKKGRLRTWIMTIAHRRVSDVLRSTYREQRLRTQSPVPEATEQQLPLDLLEAAWDAAVHRAIITEALRRLDTESNASSQSKRVFELVQLRSVPEETAARECGISVDQVYVIKHRMLKRFGEFVKQVTDEYESDEWCRGETTEPNTQS